MEFYISMGATFHDFVGKYNTEGILTFCIPPVQVALESFILQKLKLNIKK